jgi:hypothetical protein
MQEGMEITNSYGGMTRGLMFAPRHSRNSTRASTCGFCREHKSPKVTPAMEAGISNHIWTVRGLLEPA